MTESDAFPRLRAQFADVAEPSLLQVSSTLFNVALLADFATLTTLPQYENYKFGQDFWYRYGRPVKDHERPRVDVLTHSSPMELEIVIPLAVASAGGLWTLVQVAGTISTWDFNREKARQEVRNLTLQGDKAEEDIRHRRLENDMLELDLEERLALRSENAPRVMHTLVRRIEAQDIAVVELDLTNGPES